MSYTPPPDKDREQRLKALGGWRWWLTLRLSSIKVAVAQLVNLLRRRGQ